MKMAKLILSELCAVYSSTLTYTDAKQALINIQNGMDSESDFLLELDGMEFRIIDAQYIDEIGAQECADIFRECYDLDRKKLGFLYDYIDFDQAGADALRIDGYGHCFASYDHNESEAYTRWDGKINEHWYMFRTN